MKVHINTENLDLIKEKGVYRIYNSITKESYVGSTWKSFKHRWKQHLSELKKKKHHSILFQEAFNVYGTDNFICEILEVVTDETILLEREAYFIAKFNAIEAGYNRNPNPNRTPMKNKNSREKSSKTHKKFWEDLEKTMSEEEFKAYKLEYMKKCNLGIGKEPWNKGIKMNETQTKNMKKPKVNGVSEKMKEVHKNNAQKFKDRADYIIVYDVNKKWLNTFWCVSDLVAYSESEHNNLPIKIRKKSDPIKLNESKILYHIKDGKLYKGLYFKRAPKSRKLSCANAVNSWKAETEPIMSQAESTLSEGAETTGEV